MHYNDWHDDFMVGYIHTGDYRAKFGAPTTIHGELEIPCWSLAALLGVLAKIANKIDDDGSVDLSSFMGQWSVNMFDCPVEATDNYDNPIDACYNMIIKLNELKML
jgi:hypothetical protein